jgi:hypothetical protein
MPASPPCPPFALSPSACALLYAGSAWAETARVTFLLVNDIYLIADQMMPDGKRRGGFARLAAVVKAERAKGNVILAHAGDTLSPSLMSGLDRGAHILALTNLIAPDIFTPGPPTVATRRMRPRHCGAAAPTSWWRSYRAHRRQRAHCIEVRHPTPAIPAQTGIQALDLCLRGDTRR